MTRPSSLPGSDDEAGSLVMPAMSDEQTASWHALMDLYERLPNGWTLVGGQLVHVHCAERDHYPPRPTDDADTVVDIRADPDMLESFTQVLLDLGFKPDMSGDGLQHRWRKGAAQIDVLLPDGVGERAAARIGAGGAPTLTTPGGTQALRRTAALAVSVDGRHGWVRRPDLVGALVMKAAAHTAPGDSGKGRHRMDFVTLTILISRRDFPEAGLSNKDRKRLRDMVAACRADAIAMEVEGADGGLNRLERAAGLRP
jgi:hypothetical protein